MTIAAGPRLAAAKTMLKHFAHGGDAPPGGKPDPARQASPVGWPVSRQELAMQLDRRIEGRDRPEQIETSYCGPAAFLYCLLQDRPDIYVDYAIGLWVRGEYQFGVPSHKVELAGGKGIRQSLADIHAARAKRRDTRFVSDLDWMTMASLSASTRRLGWIMGRPRDTDAGKAVTLPQVLKGWFTAAGCSSGCDTMGVGLEPASIESTLKLMAYWPSCWIVLQIDASLIQTGDVGFFTNRHWVVVSRRVMPTVQIGSGGPVVRMGDALSFYQAEEKKMWNMRVDKLHDYPKPAEWQTSLHVVSWGNEARGVRNPKLGYLYPRVYGGFAFTHMR